jgi:AcrR family transcriptional regulator
VLREKLCLLPWQGGRTIDSMRLKHKTGYHHGDLRRTLLDVSISVIDKYGVDALNLRELAIRTGVSSGAPYHHFVNRDALLAAIAEEGFSVLEMAMVRERDTAQDDATSRLAALGRAYVNFATAHRGHFRVMFRRDLGSAEFPELLKARPRAFQLLCDAMEECQRSGVAPAGDLQPLVLTAWSTVHGLATLWIDGALPRKGLDPNRLAPTVAALLSSMFAALGREQASGSCSKARRARTRKTLQR